MLPTASSSALDIPVGRSDQPKGRWSRTVVNAPVVNMLACAVSIAVLHRNLLGFVGDLLEITNDSACARNLTENATYRNKGAVLGCL